MSTGFATAASGDSSAAVWPCKLVGELARSEPLRLEGVDGEDRRAPGIGEHADAAPRGSGWLASSAVTSNSSRERVGPNHAGLMEERIDGDVEARQRARCG